MTLKKKKKKKDKNKKNIAYEDIKNVINPAATIRISNDAAGKEKKAMNDAANVQKNNEAALAKKIKTIDNNIKPIIVIKNSNKPVVVKTIDDAVRLAKKALEDQRASDLANAKLKIIDDARIKEYAAAKQKAIDAAYSKHKVTDTTANQTRIDTANTSVSDTTSTAGSMMRAYDDSKKLKAATKKASLPVCMICLDAPRVIALLQCGHKCYCEACFAIPSVRCQLEYPYCRGNVTDHVRIFD